MSYADSYIRKNKGNFFCEPTNFLPLKMIVVIPCLDEPGVKYTIQSLFNCEYPGVDTGIVVIVNSSEKSSKEVLAQNRKTVIELNALSSQSKSLIQLFVVNIENLPEKHGGVGWARKIGMDWAISLFNHFDEAGGIIASLDADTLVEKNYLQSVCNHFVKCPDNVAATIYFEHHFHPHDLRSDRLEKAAVFYELYMRYYRNALLFAGFPNSIYTVGSCFAVKAGSYVAQGGMNRRKAGEDFYFLHKMAILGKVGEINSTIVCPSARVSDRVPFGTGPAISKYCLGDISIEFTYPLKAFQVLKLIFSSVDVYYEKGNKLIAEDMSDDVSFIDFCKETGLHEEIRELSANCSTKEIFTVRFFHIFNALKILKWLNYSLLHRFEKERLLNECKRLLQFLGIKDGYLLNEPEILLNLFRSLDKSRANH